MATDIFIKVDGIQGEAVDASCTGWIEVLSWDLAMSQRGTAHRGAGAGAGKVRVSDLSFVKYVDRSTPNLIKLCCSGKHFKNATLVIRKAGGKPLEYFRIKMSDGIVASVAPGGNSGEERLTENVALNFAAFTVEYVPQNKDGSGGPVIPASWNIARNAEK